MQTIGASTDELWAQIVWEICAIDWAKVDETNYLQAAESIHDTINWATIAQDVRTEAIGAY